MVGRKPFLDENGLSYTQIGRWADGGEGGSACPTLVTVYFERGSSTGTSLEVLTTLGAPSA